MASAAEVIAAELAPAEVEMTWVSQATKTTVPTISGKKTRSSRAEIDGPQSRRSGNDPGPPPPPTLLPAGRTPRPCSAPSESLAAVQERRVGTEQVAHARRPARSPLRDTAPTSGQKNQRPPLPSPSPHRHRDGASEKADGRESRHLAQRRQSELVGAELAGTTNPC